MTSTSRSCCAYCDRAVFLVVAGEPRCDWHVIPDRLPLHLRIRIHERRYAATRSVRGERRAHPVTG